MLQFSISQFIASNRQRLSLNTSCQSVKTLSVISGDVRWLATAKVDGIDDHLTRDMPDCGLRLGCCGCTYLTGEQLNIANTDGECKNGVVSWSCNYEYHGAKVQFIQYYRSIKSFNSNKFVKTLQKLLLHSDNRAF